MGINVLTASPEECEEFQTLPIGYTSCLPGKGKRFTIRCAH